MAQLEGVGKWLTAFPLVTLLLTGSAVSDADSKVLLDLDPAKYSGDDEAGRSLKHLYTSKIQPQSYARAVESLKEPMGILETSTLEGLVEFDMSRMPITLEECTPKKWQPTRISDEQLNDSVSVLTACGLEDVAGKARVLQRCSAWLSARFRLAGAWQERGTAAAKDVEVSVDFAKAISGFKTEHGNMVDWCTVHADRWSVIRVAGPVCLAMELQDLTM